MIYVSIIGDSISTYEGYNPDGYAVYYDNYMQRKNKLYSVYDTWWAKVNQALSAYLCVNNSYSGSKVTGVGFPSASSQERISNLHVGELIPDIILIYIGTNDFGNGIKIYENDYNFHQKDNTTFYNAYMNMVQGIRNNYPKAKIVCGTLMRSKIIDAPEWGFPECFGGIKLEEYNMAIRKICIKTDCCLADLSYLNLRYETLDGTHPTILGHQTIANAWIEALKNLNIINTSRRV
ncbi:MAG: hypothetical protein IJ141_05080 [Lachnospiraceae bacterium]|nr:hypothetical protein [Lachnospiraceae bacterium]